MWHLNRFSPKCFRICLAMFFWWDRNPHMRQATMPPDEFLSLSIASSSRGHRTYIDWNPKEENEDTYQPVVFFLVYNENSNISFTVLFTRISFCVVIQLFCEIFITHFFKFLIAAIVIFRRYVHDVDTNQFFHDDQLLSRHMSLLCIFSCLVKFNFVLNPLSQTLQRKARKSEWTCICLAKFFLFVQTPQIGHSLVSEGFLFLFLLIHLMFLQSGVSFKPRKGNNEVKNGSLEYEKIPTSIGALYFAMHIGRIKHVKEKIQYMHTLHINAYRFGKRFLCSPNMSLSAYFREMFINKV